MEVLRRRKPTGMSTRGLRICGLLFVALGILGRGLVQTHILGLGTVTTQELMALLESSPEMMTYASVGLVLQALETCAIPIFAFLLAEGLQHTASFRNYLTRMLGVALLSEIPYNLVFSDKLLDFSSRNPVFGLVVTMCAIWFYGRYPGKELKNLLVKALVVLCAMVWCGMLSIDYGSNIVIIASVVWAFRAKPSMRNLAGASATILCSMSSMLFMAAPMGFLAVFTYNGENGEMNKYVKYLAYPVLLLAVYLFGKFYL